MPRVSPQGVMERRQLLSEDERSEAEKGRLTPGAHEHVEGRR